MPDKFWMVEVTTLEFDEQKWDAGPNDRHGMHHETVYHVERTLDAAMNKYNDAKRFQSIRVLECAEIARKDKGTNK